MVMFPSSKEFIENKKISDRTYAWCLLNGSYNESGIYIDKNYNSGARDLGIDRRTFKKRLQILIENGYIEERENCYVIPRKELQYKRYIYRDIAEGLYNSGMENIIKLFIVLSTYHDRYKGNQNEDFSYINSSLPNIEYLGLSNATVIDGKTINKISFRNKKLNENICRICSERF